MAAVLVRPRNTAPLQTHLYHFLKFLVQVTPNVGEHRQLMITTLHYLLSISLSSLYTVRITTALAKVTVTVQTEGVDTAIVRRNLEEYSALYRDLMDRIVTSTDGAWRLPAPGSSPSPEVVAMDYAWQSARNQWEFSTVWDLNPN